MRTPDAPGRDGLRKTPRTNYPRQILALIYLPEREPNSVLVITAYELADRPLAAYRRRRRRKHS